MGVACETVKYGLTKEKSFTTDFPACDSSEKAAQFARRFYVEDIEIYESFFIILLASNGKVLGWAKIGQGGTSGVLVDAKLVAKFAIDALARSVICVHNHPGGNPKPSPQDMQLTRKIREGLRLFEIELLDHIVLTSDSYHSMRDEYDMDF